jgi:hypothetical protein
MHPPIIPKISDLQREKFIKENEKLKIFNLVLQNCIEKISYTNTKTDQTFVYFEVPNIITGSFDYEKMGCVIFLMEQFVKQNYYVEFIQPGYIYIDWSVKASKKVDDLCIEDIIHTCNPKKLKQQTKELLKKYPHVGKIQYIYEDTAYENKNQRKNKKK